MELPSALINFVMYRGFGSRRVFLAACLRPWVMTSLVNRLAELDGLGKEASEKNITFREQHEKG